MIKILLYNLFGWVAAVCMVAFMWGGVPGAGAQRAPATQEISDFQVPEFDEDNNLKSILYGRKARVHPNGVVGIWEMRADFFDAKRSIEMRVTAETCMYNRITKDAQSDDHVRIARDNLIITGRGFVWNSESGRFEIHNDAKVVLREAGRIVREDDAE